MAKITGLQQSIRVGAGTPYSLTFPAADAAGPLMSDGSGVLSLGVTTGTWSPELKGSSVSGQTYGARIGTYMKVGKLVSVQCYVLLTATGTIVGSDLYVTGLPFTSVNTAYNWGVGPVRYGGLDTSRTGFMDVNAVIQHNVTYAQLLGVKYSGDGSATHSNGVTMVPDDLTNTASIGFSAVYEAA
jgi:hypothetical protein